MTDINEEILSIRSEVDQLREALADNDVYVKTWSDNYDAAQDEITRLRAQNERLRHALALCRTELFSAASYRGYEGGPLDSPSVDLALREADAALKGESDE